MKRDRQMIKATETVEVILGSRVVAPEQLIERIKSQYRSVSRHRDLGGLTVAGRLIAVVAIVSSDVVDGSGTAVVWLAWMMIAELWFLAVRTPLAVAPVAYIGLLSHLPAPEPRNARQDAGQHVVRFTLAVSATTLLTMFGLRREYQLGGVRVCLARTPPTG